MMRTRIYSDFTHSYSNYCSFRSNSKQLQHLFQSKNRCWWSRFNNSLAPSLGQGGTCAALHAHTGAQPSVHLQACESALALVPKGAKAWLFAPKGAKLLQLQLQLASVQTLLGSPTLFLCSAGQSLRTSFGKRCLFLCLKLCLEQPETLTLRTWKTDHLEHNMMIY